MTHILEATIQSIEGERVTLLFSDGQTLRVPPSVCEGIPKVGAVVKVVVAALGSEDAGRTALAKELVNEILGT